MKKFIQGHVSGGAEVLQHPGPHVSFFWEGGAIGGSEKNKLVLASYRSVRGPHFGTAPGLTLSLMLA